jgi:hypothetical protein
MLGEHCSGSALQGDSPAHRVSKGNSTIFERDQKCLLLSCLSQAFTQVGVMPIRGVAPVTLHLRISIAFVGSARSQCLLCLSDCVCVCVRVCVCACVRVFASVLVCVFRVSSFSFSRRILRAQHQWKYNQANSNSFCVSGCLYMHSFWFYLA